MKDNALRVVRARRSGADDDTKKLTLTLEEFTVIAGEFDKQINKHCRDTFERCHKMVVDMGSMLTHIH